MRITNQIKKNWKTLVAMAFFIHFFFIIIYSIKQAVSLSLAHDTYITHTIPEKKLKAIDYNLARLILHKQNSVNTDYLGFYMTLTGAQTPFNYFVANITGVEKMIFELEFKDGTKQVILPVVSSGEMAVRFKHLLNLMETTPNELYRNLLVKRITEHEIKNYPNIKSVTTILGVVDIPSFNNYTKKQGLYFRLLYQYNFKLK